MIITGASLLSGEFVDEDYDSGCMDELGGDKEVIVILSGEFEKHDEEQREDDP